MSQELSRYVLRRGVQEEMPAPKSLRAGPLTLLFDPRTGLLRHLRVGDHEAVRAIYGAVRDHNWETLVPVISDLVIHAGDESFDVRFQAASKGEAGVLFEWEARITGDEQGTVRYEFDGEAKAGFQKNRIGLCVLHPMAECAGNPCRVEHVDGSIEEGMFPRHIAPHQPFKDIRAVTYEAALGQKVEVRFEGEVFEMEDQRNWTDASFKTYGTPIEWGFPKAVTAGDRVRQQVTVSLVAPVRKILPVVQGRGAQLSISTTPVLTRPALGLGMAGHENALSAREVERLRNLRLSHLRVDIHPSRDGWADLFRRAATEAAAIGSGLHVAVFLGDRAEEELDVLSAVVNEARPRILLWLIFREGETTSNEESIRLARKKLAGPGVHSLIAAGSSGFFADLNRNRPPEESTALPCYSINPQVHAFDDVTMVENLSGQAATVESTGQFCRQAVVVSPVTLRPRRDANDPLESYAPGKDNGSRLPASVDPRQMSLFGAGWTLGSLARLALAGNLHCVTYYETSGWRGVMETEDGSPVPGLFPSIPGAVFPMYHVFADVAGYDRIYPTHSSHPLQTEGLTLVDAKGARRVLVANFLNEPQEVRIKTGSCRANVRYLDETNAQRAMLEPEAFHQEPGETKESVSAKIELQLQPYALARVDILPG